MNSYVRGLGSSFGVKLSSFRGRIIPDFEMRQISWFRTGGIADILFEPADEDDLALFLRSVPHEIPVYVVGLGSNLLVREGGVRGFVIRLPSKSFGFAKCSPGFRINAGASCSGKRLSLLALEQGIGGFHFYYGIPGSVGGALRMNSGANGIETSDRLIQIRAIDRAGNFHVIEPAAMGYSYRSSCVSEGMIFLSAVFQGLEEDQELIREEIKNAKNHREAVQPVREKTGGSTFKNPPGKSAWKEIDSAGCRGLRIGGAMISTMHCNFMINTGNCTSQDLECLGETVRSWVLKNSGIRLDWEIERIGDFLPGQKIEEFLP